MHSQLGAMYIVQAGQPTILITAGPTLTFDRDPNGREITRTINDTLTLACDWDRSDGRDEPN